MESEKCILGKKYHKNVKDKRLLEATQTCLLFSNKDVYGIAGMSLATELCVHCCMACLRVLEIRAELIRNSTITDADERGNPDMLIQFLPENLVAFGEVMLKANKSFKQAEAECKHCAASTWSHIPRSAPAIKTQDPPAYCH